MLSLLFSRYHKCSNCTYNNKHSPKPHTTPLSQKMASINAKGLNISEKRSQILRECHKLKANIVCIQETHFVSGKTPKLSDKEFAHAFHSMNKDSKIKGVPILISKNTFFQMTDSLCDQEGRHIFLKGKINSRPITITNIYAPNTKQVAFFRHICDLLSSFSTDILIFGGDFNVPLNPLLDTSSGTSAMPQRALKQIKLQLQGLMLHDTRRTLNPQGKDYTYFSTLHHKYSRIDYFFISQPGNPLLRKITIENMTLLDHHPITILLVSPETISRTKTWRLNSSLLKDPINIEQFATSLRDYFSLNNTTETSTITQWEVHKCIIPGEFIKTASKIKREHQSKISACISRIRSVIRNVTQTKYSI